MTFMEFRRKVPEILFSFFLCLATTSEGLAEASMNRAEQIKATYLLQFTYYVDWPSDVVSSIQNKTLSLCVFGEDDITQVLGELDLSKSGLGPPVSLKTIKSYSAAKVCQIIFVSNNAEEFSGESLTTTVEELSNSLEGRHVLIVGDRKGAAQRGAAIGFVLDKSKNRIVLEINEKVAEQFGLKIRSQLLALSRYGVVRLVN